MVGVVEEGEDVERGRSASADGTLCFEGSQELLLSGLLELESASRRTA